MSDLNTLYRLQTEGLEEADCVRFFAHEHQRWLKARDEFARMVQPPTSDPERAQKEEIVRHNIEIAISYYYHCIHKLPFDKTLLNLATRFVDSELVSYPIEAAVAYKTKEWAKEQGLHVYLDSVRVDGVEYHRVLSKPWLRTQTSIAGVIFQRNEVIDIPHRPMQDFSKLMERAELYCKDHFKGI